MGARSAGMGYTSACTEDEWSLFNNVGGLASTKKTSIAAAYDTQPSFKSFNRMAAAFTLPINIGVTALGVFRFGDELYNEQIISLGFANTFGLASLGLKANYIQYKAQGFGSKGLITFSFGGIAKVTEKILIGAHITNINQPSLSAIEDEKLPTTLILGVGFKLSSKTFVSTELQKELDYFLKWKGGLEYQPFEKFCFRTGFNINPNAAFAGIGFNRKTIKVDYAYHYSFTAGSRHQATIAYHFHKKK
jgi:hypothetical protein